MSGVSRGVIEPLTVDHYGADVIHLGKGCRVEVFGSGYLIVFNAVAGVGPDTRFAVARDLVEAVRGLKEMMEDNS